MIDSHLVAGQWVDLSMEELPTPILLSGFVLSTKGGELLLTFPELPSPPKGLEADAQATLRYSNGAERFATVAQIQRIASGPPVTVTFKALSPLGVDKRRPLRMPSRLPVVVRVQSSSVSSSSGQTDGSAFTEDVSATGMLLSTSLLLAIGDLLLLQVFTDSSGPEIHVRVVRVQEGAGGAHGHFAAGVELQPRDEVERQAWLAFVARVQNRGRM